MNTTSHDLQELIKKIALKYTDEESAEYFAIEITEAHIRKFPRSNVIKEEVLKDLPIFEKFKNIKPEILKELPSLIKINFNGLPLGIHLKWMHDILEQKAKQNGIAILAFDNSAGMHALHTHSQGLAKRGLFALGAFYGGPVAVIPLNGTSGLFGTNPITYAFPTQDGNVVVDMATSDIPYFELMKAQRNNEQLSPTAAVDKDGFPTSDPNATIFGDISNLQPMGANHRGYNINYLFEVMTSALIGAKLFFQMDTAGVAVEHGGFMIAIDISAFIPLDKFKSEVSEMNSIIRKQRPVKGKSVIVPGDNNSEKLNLSNIKNEVLIDDETWKELLKLAD